MVLPWLAKVVHPQLFSSAPPPPGFSAHNHSTPPTPLLPSSSLSSSPASPAVMEQHTGAAATAADPTAQNSYSFFFVVWIIATSVSVTILTMVLLGTFVWWRYRRLLLAWLLSATTSDASPLSEPLLIDVVAEEPVRTTAPLPVVLSYGGAAAVPPLDPTQRSSLSFSPPRHYTGKGAIANVLPVVARRDPRYAAIASTDIFATEVSSLNSSVTPPVLFPLPDPRCPTAASSAASLSSVVSADSGLPEMDHKDASSNPRAGVSVVIPVPWFKEGCTAPLNESSTLTANPNHNEAKNPETEPMQLGEEKIHNTASTTPAMWVKETTGHPSVAPPADLSLPSPPSVASGGGAVRTTPNTNRSSSSFSVFQPRGSTDRAAERNMRKWQYQIHRRIGRGSFSSVYLAMRTSDGGLFALKYLSCGDEHERCNAFRECRILTRLRGHPNIISLKDMLVQFQMVEDEECEEVEETPQEPAPPKEEEQEETFAAGPEEPLQPLCVAAHGIPPQPSSSPVTKSSSSSSSSSQPQLVAAEGSLFTTPLHNTQHLPLSRLSTPPPPSAEPLAASLSPPNSAMPETHRTPLQRPVTAAWPRTPLSAPARCTGALTGSVVDSSSFALPPALASSVLEPSVLRVPPVSSSPGAPVLEENPMGSARSPGSAGAVVGGPSLYFLAPSTKQNSATSSDCSDQPMQPFSLCPRSLFKITPQQLILGRGNEGVWVPSYSSALPFYSSPYRLHSHHRLYSSHHPSPPLYAHSHQHRYNYRSRTNQQHSTGVEDESELLRESWAEEHRAALRRRRAAAFVSRPDHEVVSAARSLPSSSVLSGSSAAQRQTTVNTIAASPLAPHLELYTTDELLLLQDRKQQLRLQHDQHQHGTAARHTVLETEVEGGEDDAKSREVPFTLDVEGVAEGNRAEDGVVHRKALSMLANSISTAGSAALEGTGPSLPRSPSCTAFISAAASRAADSGARLLSGFPRYTTDELLEIQEAKQRRQTEQLQHQDLHARQHLFFSPELRDPQSLLPQRWGRPSSRRIMHSITRALCEVLIPNCAPSRHSRWRGTELLHGGERSARPGFTTIMSAGGTTLGSLSSSVGLRDLSSGKNFYSVEPHLDFSTPTGKRGGSSDPSEDTLTSHTTPDLVGFPSSSHRERGLHCSSEQIIAPTPLSESTMAHTSTTTTSHRSQSILYVSAAVCAAMQPMCAPSDTPLAWGRLTTSDGTSTTSSSTLVQRGPPPHPDSSAAPMVTTADIPTAARHHPWSAHGMRMEEGYVANVSVSTSVATHTAKGEGHSPAGPASATAASHAGVFFPQPPTRVVCSSTEDGAARDTTATASTPFSSLLGYGSKAPPALLPPPKVLHSGAVLGDGDSTDEGGAPSVPVTEKLQQLFFHPSVSSSGTSATHRGGGEHNKSTAPHPFTAQHQPSSNASQRSDRSRRAFPPLCSHGMDAATPFFLLQYHRQKNGAWRRNSATSGGLGGPLTGAASSVTERTRAGGKPKKRGFLCLIMDYHAMGDLSHYVQQQQRPVTNGVAPSLREKKCLTETQLMSIAYQGFKVLDHLHSQTPPIVHRDLKPENILIKGTAAVLCGAPDGEVEEQDTTMPMLVPFIPLVITDFGLAIEMEEELTESSSGSSHVRKRRPGGGTKPYMAPEVFHSGAVPASDVWSLACVLYALATGRLDRHRICMMAEEAKSEGFAAMVLTDLLKHYSLPFATFVVSLLVVDPEHRPTASQVMTYFLVKRRSGHKSKKSKRAAAAETPEKASLTIEEEVEQVVEFDQKSQFFENMLDL